MAAELLRRSMLAGLAGAAFQMRPRAAAADAPSLAAALAAYADGLTVADLPPDIVELAKAHIIDALGCAMAAFNQPPVRAARAVALGMAGGGATVAGTAARVPMDWAAFANGAAIRNLDLNDAYTGREIGHPSDNLAACLAVAEVERRSGAELILAAVLAYEIDCRLLDTVQISTRGWDHPSFSLAPAALAAGKLMGLSAAQLAQAVNLALAGHLAFNQTRLGDISNWKGMADADAARSAVFAAELARAGITGPAPAFEGDAGFFRVVSGPFTLDTAQFGGRGGHFKLADCAIKFYPAQALLQTAIPAAAKIGAQIADFGQITAIRVDTTLAGKTYAADTRQKWAPETSETADHSLPYIVARALIDREVTEASYAPAALHDPRLHPLLERLTVEEDPALSKLYPQKMPTRVTVTLADGHVIAQQVDDLPGFGGAPVTRADIEAKFRRDVRPIWPDAQVAAFLDYAWTLDRQTDLGGLFSRMVVAT